MRLSLLLLILLGFVTLGFDVDQITSNYVLVFMNILSGLLILLISIDLYKFINITRRNPTFVLAYVVIALMLFSSVVNVFFFFYSEQMEYFAVYFMDRTIILVMMIIVYVAFRKFRKVLGSRG